LDQKVPIYPEWILRATKYLCEFYASVSSLSRKPRSAQHAHIWGRVLDLLRVAKLGRPQTVTRNEDAEDLEGDNIVGRYLRVDLPLWGGRVSQSRDAIFICERVVAQTKVFYDVAGTGPVDVIFLHTAGADSRQFHGIMNVPGTLFSSGRKRFRSPASLDVLKRCTMYAVDLPYHGRSFPPDNAYPGQHALSEDKVQSSPNFIVGFDRS
jgi:hypothetical protein